jgi:hypothetical protein
MTNTTKRYSPEEIEVARDYIGHHADSLPKYYPLPKSTKAERLARRAAGVEKMNERARAAGIR